MRQEVKEKLLSINDLSRKCGYFSSNTFIKMDMGAIILIVMMEYIPIMGNKLVVMMRN